MRNNKIVGNIYGTEREGTKWMATTWFLNAYFFLSRSMLIPYILISEVNKRVFSSSETKDCTIHSWQFAKKDFCNFFCFAESCSLKKVSPNDPFAQKYYALFSLAYSHWLKTLCWIVFCSMDTVSSVWIIFGATLRPKHMFFRSVRKSRERTGSDSI